MTIRALIDAVLVLCAFSVVAANPYAIQLSNFLSGRPIISFGEALRMMENGYAVKPSYTHNERYQQSKSLSVDELEGRRPFNTAIFSWLMPSQFR
ncbi:unnamed protein product [Toxocara canis]|nr:unnamed protein product [Toxocara canis]